MNVTRLINAFHEVIKALETPADESTPPVQPTAELEVPATGAPKRPGRPPAGAKVEGATDAAPVAPAAATEDPHPVDPAAPVASQDDVRAALKALQAETDQATAVGVLKAASGADNLSSLKPALNGTVVAACKKAMPAAPAPAVVADPWDEPAPAAAVAEAAPTLLDVRAAVVKAQGRTGVDTVQKVVMAHGGQAPDSTGALKPSLQAIPIPQYAAVIAAVNALPTTK